MEKRPEREPEQSRRRHVRRSSDADEFWDGIGVDVDRMSPKAQAVTGAIAGGLVVLAAVLLIAFTPLWWMIFIFGWTAFPAFGLLLRGIAGLSEGEGQRQVPAANSKERELLGVLRRHEEVTPTQAAMETSLTVEEADGMLKDLAAKGHLDVRVRGGGIFYGLWKSEDENREIEGDR